MLSGDALGIAAALGSSAAWALGAILFQNLTRDLSPLPLTLGKALIGFVLLTVAVAFVDWAALTAREWLYLLLSGLIGIAIGDACFFAALRDLKARAAVALMLLCPVLTIALAMLFLRERPSLFTLGGIALTLAGVGVAMTAEGNPSEGSTRTRGLLFGVGAIVCMAVATLISAVALREVPALHAAWVRMGAGAAGLAMYAVARGQGRSWWSELRRLHLSLRLLGATAVVTFGGFWLSLVALRYTSVAVANTLNSLEALFILPLTAIFLHQRPPLRAIAGAVCGCAGVAIIIATTG